MIKFSSQIFIYIFLSFIIFSCDTQKDNSRGLPSVTGKAGEVVLVIDNNHWESGVGMEFQRIFKSEFPAIPQTEPMFSLIKIPYSAMSRIIETHRNLVMTKIIKSAKESKILVSEDVYAFPQMVVTAIAKDTTEMKKLLIREKERLRALFVKRERDVLVESYKRYEDKGVAKFLKKRHKISLVVPKGYTVDVDSSDFSWLAHETAEMSQGIFVYRYPYVDTSDFSLESLVEMRNQFTRRYVPASIEGSYMSTDMVYYPERKEFVRDGKYICELRGLWNAKGDFMGGPFISYSMVNEKTNEIVCVEGFVYAPNKKKRNYVRQLEAILYSMAIDNTDETTKNNRKRNKKSKK